MQQIKLSKRMLAASLGLTLVGCTTIQLVSKYDDETDSQASQIQKDFIEFQVALDTALDSAALSYGKNQDFYKKEQVAIATLANRVAVIPKNGITVEQVKILQTNFAWLAMLHKGCIAGPFSDENRKIVEQVGADVSIACRKDHGADQDMPDQSAHTIRPTVARGAIGAITTGLNAIITLEVAKKRGEAK